MDAAIAVQGVSKKFMLRHDRPRSFQELLIQAVGKNHNHSREEFWALRDVDLVVEQGETLGLVGANGAGKSTLLKLIARIIEPTRGSIAVNGRLTALLELGAGFHPDLSGRENIFLNGSILGLSTREMRSRFDEIVAFAELEQFIDVPLRHYSSGMQVRLGFAVTTSLDPDVLLIDEVLAVGDEAFQKKCLSRIEDFRRCGKTIVLVSHDLQSIKRLCSRALWIETAHPAADGPATEIVERYRRHVWAKEARKLAEQTSGGRRTDAVCATAPSERGAQGTNAHWGSGEVVITGVRMLDAAAAAVQLLQCGDAVTVEIEYKVLRRMPGTVFGIAIYRNDGLWCYGTNTEIDGVCLEGLPDKGVVRVDFQSLGLIAGTYTLDVAIHDSQNRAYDYYHPYCTFQVRSLLQDVGVYRPAHHWRVQGQH